MTTEPDRAKPSSHDRALPSLLHAAANADTPDARLFGALVTARACRNELALLGLSRAQLAGLLTRQFPHLPSADAGALVSTVAMALLPSTHAAFVATLHTRLMDDANPAAPRDDADCLASIIAHACLRPDHLWRDLGLDGRDAVSAMLDRFFPALAARNVAHLRWKKFLAQEVAASLGVPPGPAPGCPGCEDFGFCFPQAR
ncbi:nitrogen fixation protein NifQ [Burkholderia sp. YIM B11467]